MRDGRQVGRRHRTFNPTGETLTVGSNPTRPTIKLDSRHNKMHNEFATLEDLTEATNIVNIAYQIIGMHQTILQQKRYISELEEVRKNYIELLNNL